MIRVALASILLIFWSACFADALYDAEESLGLSVGKSIILAANLEFLHKNTDCKKADNNNLQSKITILFAENIPDKYKKLLLSDESRKMVESAKKSGEVRVLYNQYLSMKKKIGKKACDIINNTAWKAIYSENLNAKKSVFHIYMLTSGVPEKIKNKVKNSMIPSCINNQVGSPLNKNIPKNTIDEYCSCMAEHVINNMSPDDFVLINSGQLESPTLTPLINSTAIYCRDLILNY